MPSTAHIPEAAPAGPLDRAERRAAAWPLAGSLLVCLLLSGCVHRRLIVNSDPPGALVMLEGEEIGYTPCGIDFTYYGRREITLVKDGYETLTVMQKVQTPWYQIFPMEFVTDNLSPVKINDRREFTYRMQPQVIVPTQELLERADNLRRDAQVPSATKPRR